MRDATTLALVVGSDEHARARLLARAGGGPEARTGVWRWRDQGFREAGMASLRVTVAKTGQSIAEPNVRVIRGWVTLLETHPAPVR